MRAPNPAAREKLEHARAKTAGSAQIADAAERAFVTETLGREAIMLEIMANGFRPIALYDIDGAPGHEIVQDFRIRDWHFRNRSEAEIRRELREATSLDLGNRRRIKAWASRAREAASEAYRFLFRGARSVTVDANLE